MWDSSNGRGRAHRIHITLEGRGYLGIQSVDKDSDFKNRSLSLTVGLRWANQPRAIEHKILDIQDYCSDKKGMPSLSSCPNLDGDGDRDGDGICDDDDDCDDEKGSRDLNGCPDGDEDGVPD